MLFIFLAEYIGFEPMAQRESRASLAGKYLKPLGQYSIMERLTGFKPVT